MEQVIYGYLILGVLFALWVVITEPSQEAPWKLKEEKIVFRVITLVAIIMILTAFWPFFMWNLRK